jgi:histidine biosynthesis protein/uncharacterized protein DUF4915
MSALHPTPPKDRGAAGSTPPPAVEFRYTQSESFVALLHQLDASLLVSTYQANKLLAVRPDGQGLSTLVRTFERPMGLAVAPGRLALGTRSQVWFFRDAPDIAPRIEPAGKHDACFLPRSCHVTGDIGIHEISWTFPPLAPGGRGVGGEGEVWWEVHVNGGRVPTGLEAVAWAKRVEQLGAGEIVLTSMDADGTKAGYDLEMTSAVAEAVSIPVVASGGAGSPEHVFDALTKGKADAALAASIFHYNEYGIRATKAYLHERGVAVRMT